MDEVKLCRIIALLYFRKEGGMEERIKYAEKSLFSFFYIDALPATVDVVLPESPL